MLNTKELEKLVCNLYKKLEVKAREEKIYRDLHIDFESYFKPTSMNSTLVYADERGYHYSVDERGNIQDYCTQDLFEITYKIFSFRTFMMAVNYEAQHRLNEQSNRKLIHSKQLELLELIDTRYAERCEEEFQERHVKQPGGGEVKNV